MTQEALELLPPQAILAALGVLLLSILGALVMVLIRLERRSMVTDRELGLIWRQLARVSERLARLEALAGDSRRGAADSRIPPSG